ncbi:MAG TPA: cyclohexanecarboxylate-CoA ligase [Microbacteriaceae bacterium]|nr:cyclohexanecarboxylate-CoA ligase [Microbacteriaceae bacterium]
MNDLLTSLWAGDRSRPVDSPHPQAATERPAGGVKLPRPSDDRLRRETAAGHWRNALLDTSLVDAARRHPASTALVDGAVTLTYSEVLSKVQALSRSLRDLGVVKGDVISWQLPNWYEAYIIHFAAISMGAVSNPIVPIYRHHELEFILREAGSRVVITPETFRGFDYAQMISDIRGKLPRLKHSLLVRTRPGSGAPSLDSLMNEVEGIGPAGDRSADDPVMLMFTSGTTARPKGVVHTHNTIDFEVRSIVKQFALTNTDIVFMPSPLTHMTGLAYGVQLAPAIAAPLVLQDIWEPRVAMELIDRHRCTFAFAATPFLQGILQHPEQGSFDLTSLRVVASGGADVPPQLIRDVSTRFRCTATRAYGSTEMPTVVACGPALPPEKAATTDGRPIGPATFRLLSEHGEEVRSPGEVGEIVATGPELFIGYLRPEDDEGAFASDGWFFTGDLGSTDEDGYLTIKGRKKDIVIRGGENISVTEVEQILLEHPGVTDIAIVAMPDPVMGERACAYVVPSATGDEAPTLAVLCDFLAARNMAKQKYPERLELIDELPRTPSGKVQKFLLRQKIVAQLEASSTGDPA